MQESSLGFQEVWYVSVFWQKYSGSLKIKIRPYFTKKSQFISKFEMRTFQMPSSASPSATNFSDKFYWPSNKDLYFFFFCVKVEAKSEQTIPREKNSTR